PRRADKPEGSSSQADTRPGYRGSGRSYTGSRDRSATNPTRAYGSGGNSGGRSEAEWAAAELLDTGLARRRSTEKRHRSAVRGRGNGRSSAWEILLGQRIVGQTEVMRNSAGDNARTPDETSAALPRETFLLATGPRRLDNNP